MVGVEPHDCSAPSGHVLLIAGVNRAIAGAHDVGAANRPPWRPAGRLHHRRERLRGQANQCRGDCTLVAVAVESGRSSLRIENREAALDRHHGGTQVDGTTGFVTGDIHHGLTLVQTKCGEVHEVFDTGASDATEPRGRFGDDRAAIGVADEHDRSCQRGDDVDHMVGIAVEVAERQDRSPVPRQVDCQRGDTSAVKFVLQ